MLRWLSEAAQKPPTGGVARVSCLSLGSVESVQTSTWCATARLSARRRAVHEDSQARREEACERNREQPDQLAEQDDKEVSVNRVHVAWWVVGAHRDEREGQRYRIVRGAGQRALLGLRRRGRLRGGRRH